MQVLSVIGKIIEDENLNDAQNSSLVLCSNELEDALKTKSFQMKELRRVSSIQLDINAYFLNTKHLLFPSFRTIVISQLQTFFIIPNEGNDCLPPDIEFSHPLIYYSRGLKSSVWFMNLIYISGYLIKLNLKAQWLLCENCNGCWLEFSSTLLYINHHLLVIHSFA